MPRSKEENQKIREERINEIKNAAIRVYASKGFLGTQMEDIAKEAGLAKGLLYYYFKSKNELFQNVFLELLDKAKNYTKMLTVEVKSFEQSLETFLSFMILSAFEKPMYPLAYKMIPDDLHHVFPENALEMQQSFFEHFTKPMVELFSKAMESGEIQKGNPMIQALLFTSGVLTITHHIASYPSVVDGKSKDQVFEETKRQLFYGILGRGK